MKGVYSERRESESGRDQVGNGRSSEEAGSEHDKLSKTKYCEEKALMSAVQGSSVQK